MNDIFKVGDICIIQHAEGLAEKFNGEECEIIGELKKWTAELGKTGLGYVIKAPDGVRRFIYPYQLRRKQPPADLTAWAKSKVLDIVNPQIAYLESVK